MAEQAHLRILGDRPEQPVPARSAIRIDGLLVLRDLGYVEGRRVHVVPAWSVTPGEGLAALLVRIRTRRPDVDTVVLAATGPALPAEARTLGPAERAGPDLLLAVASGAPSASDAPGVHTVGVSGASIREAEDLLRQLAWGRSTAAAALALAGFWSDAATTGADVVVVLADLEGLPPAAAA